MWKLILLAIGVLNAYDSVYAYFNGDYGWAILDAILAAMFIYDYFKFTEKENEA